MAIYELLNIKKKIPKVSRHDLTLSVNFKAVLKAYKGRQPVEARRGKKCLLCKMAVIGLVGAGIAFAIKKFK